MVPRTADVVTADDVVSVEAAPAAFGLAERPLLVLTFAPLATPEVAPELCIFAPAVDLDIPGVILSTFLSPRSLLPLPLELPPPLRCP